MNRALLQGSLQKKLHNYRDETLAMIEWYV